MRFMGLWFQTKSGMGPDKKSLAGLGKLFGEMAQAGVLVDSGGWDPAAPCSILRQKAGKVAVTDGPFTESKELIGGFIILEAASKEAALEWYTRWVELAGDGHAEIRPIYGPPPSDR
jgi:hypothetical protein